MKKYVCTVCGYVYDEAKGIPKAGIASNTAWSDLLEDWLCPLCGATKAEFQVQGEPAAASEVSIPHTVLETSTDMKELSPIEISVLCDNLARGCEKQYKREEATLFAELAAYFKAASTPEENPNFDKLLGLIETDLNQGFPNANSVSSAAKDRGALRALVWSEKVTRILKSLLTRYQKEGDAMHQNTSVYVCTICGFVYVGDVLPKVCPVCKVPDWKFEEVEGGDTNG